MLTDDYDDEMATTVGPMDDNKAENMRRYIDAVEAEVTKRRLETPIFIELVRKYLDRYDSKKTRH